MTVLRSREVISTPPSVALLKKHVNEVVEPSTQTKSIDVSSNLQGEATPLSGSSRKRSGPPCGIRRRSLRLAAKSGVCGNGEDIEILSQQGSNAFSDVIAASNECGLGNIVNGEGIVNGKLVSDELAIVVEESKIGMDSMLNKCGDTSMEQVGSSKEGSRSKKRRMEVDTVTLEAQTESNTAEKFLSLRSGKKIAKREVEVKTGSSISVYGGIGSGHKLFPGMESEGVPNAGGFEAAAMTNSESNASGDGNGNLDSKRLTTEEKGKGKVSERMPLMASCTVKLDVDSEVELSNGSKDVTGVDTIKKLSRKEKGKEAVIGNDLPEDLRTMGKDSGFKVEATHTAKSEATQYVERVAESTVNMIDRGYMKQFRDIAKRNASRFAHFPSQEEENRLVDQAARETQPQEEVEVEDWPGPFSTAMKIIHNREKNMNVQTQKSSIPKSMATPLIWTPKRDKKSKQERKIVPSLQDLCMGILVKNADAITSLDCVPDVLRHKLCRLLCDSRKMNCHFLGLLTFGFPSEIRLRDCSWLTEELFLKSFEGCGTSNLAVLQLDQCGRCLPDYTLLATLARLPNSLPALTTISLKGACRLSDAGLTALVSSTPSLRSINLSQCSLLSSDGIKCLSDSLGSVLKELYLDDCQEIDCGLILPFLFKLEQLEVLSVAAIHTVSDNFVDEFVTRHGHTMRELVLKDCVNLTDCSVRAVAEFCPGLCAIDLSNLRKLKDSSVSYLANGCRALHKLKLSRNAFSDEAIAAYLETCGNSLKELSLNNVNKVSLNTAMSLAKCCKNLLVLDLSWCRNLTDEALGLIADNCLSLEVLKLFGCTQITNVFLDGHSNPNVKIIGLKMTPVLEHLNLPDPLQGPLLYSSSSPSL